MYHWSFIFISFLTFVTLLFWEIVALTLLSFKGNRNLWLKEIVQQCNRERYEKKKRAKSLYQMEQESLTSLCAVETIRQFYSILIIII